MVERLPYKQRVTGSNVNKSIRPINNKKRSVENEMGWRRTAEPVSWDQILGRERGQGKKRQPCSAEREQDWQPYPVDPYSAIVVVGKRGEY